ncbi:MAG: ABC transporter permease [Clostridia bacterium]|nr:ABC transporter permease [Clostridia bacterium]
MSNVKRVFTWEFTRNLKNPTFLVLTILMPVLMLAGALVGGLASYLAVSEEYRVAVIDETGALYSTLEEVLVDTPVELSLFPQERLEQLVQEVTEGEYSGYIHFTSAALEEGVIGYYVKDAKERNPFLQEGVREAVRTYRFQNMGLDTEQIQAATGPVALQNRTLAGEEASLADSLIPLGISMALIFSIIFTGQVLMLGVLKEKRNRIVEILLSSISSWELLLGKLAAFVSLGLLQITFWVGIGLTIAVFFVDFSQLSISFSELFTSLLFFLSGYILLASLYAVLGATMKDAESGSQLQGLVVLVPLLPVVLSGAIFISPNALWVRLFSFCPPFIPVTMLIRNAATSLPWWEIAASLTVLVLSTALFLYLGARIFDRSILLFERTLSFKEIGRMMKKNYS